MATTCCARMSSGLRGTRVSSMAPSSMRSAIAAASTRSPRWVGKMVPREADADAVPGAADALQPGGDGERRAHLHDQVDGAHVDAELQRGGGDDRRQPALLEHLLDHRALLARDRPVVGAHQVLAGEVVELAADSRSARRRELTNTIVDRCARISSRSRGVTAGQMLRRGACGAGGVTAALGAAVEVAHVVDRDLDGQLHRLAHAGVDDHHVTVDAAEEAGDLAERSLGGGQADALRVACRSARTAARG